MERETLVTEQGLEQLQQELDQLVNERRPAMAARIKAARELGDLKENAEYHAAKEEQGFLETRILQIEDRIRTAKIVEKTSGGVIGVGSVVDVVDVESGEQERYEVTGAIEADPVNNKVSNESPIGQALMGRKAGDTVRVSLPRGSMQLRIKTVSG